MSTYSTIIRTKILVGYIEVDTDIGGKELLPISNFSLFSDNVEESYDLIEDMELHKVITEVSLVPKKEYELNIN